LITGSLNGCLMVWDFLDAALLQIIDIGQPIFHICAHDKFKDSIFLTASHPSKSKNSTGVLFLVCGPFSPNLES
jgi:NET1-associated nuclear protein 1 (U3 small nucleolar RNA-associated protein 17)